jgi:hypothetical protein
MYTLKENMKRFNTKNLNEQDDMAFGQFAKSEKPATGDVTQANVDSARDKAEKFGSEPWGYSFQTKAGEEVMVNNFEDAVAAIRKGVDKRQVLENLNDDMPGIMELCKLA